MTTPLIIDGAWLIRAVCSHAIGRERTHVNVPQLISALSNEVPDIGTIHWFDAARNDRPLHDLPRDMLMADGVELHLGFMRSHGRSWTQKRVDTLLTTSMAEMAWTGKKRIALIGGDEDLIPGIESAQRAGATVDLYSVQFDGVSTSPADSMIGQACDSVHVLDIAAMQACITPTLSRAGKAIEAMVKAS